MTVNRRSHSNYCITAHALQLLYLILAVEDVAIYTRTRIHAITI